MQIVVTVTSAGYGIVDNAGCHNGSVRIVGDAGICELLEQEINQNIVLPPYAVGHFREEFGELIYFDSLTWYIDKSSDEYLDKYLIPSLKRRGFCVEKVSSDYTS